MIKIIPIFMAIFSLSFGHSVLAGSNSVQAGFNTGFVPDGGYSMINFGYERAVSDAVTLGGRLYSFDYDLEEDDSLNYKEDGSGTGAEFVFRFYTGKKALHGFYLGAAVGLATIDWNWTENFTAGGNGSSSLLSLGFVLGAKIYFGNSPVYFEPGFYLPYYISLDIETSDGEDELSIGVAPSVGIAIGSSF